MLSIRNRDLQSINFCFPSLTSYLDLLVKDEAEVQSSVRVEHHMLALSSRCTFLCTPVPSGLTAVPSTPMDPAAPVF
jgi:hypothetical protein